MCNLNALKKRNKWVILFNRLKSCSALIGERGVMKIKVLGFALMLGLAATLGACGGETTTTPAGGDATTPAAEPQETTAPAAPATTPAAPDAGKTPASDTKTPAAKPTP